MVTNGQLSAMSPEQRASVINELPHCTRRTLAHIASLGAQHRTKKAVEHLDGGRTSFARRLLAGDVIRMTGLSAQLTTDVPETSDTTNHPTPTEIASTIDALLDTVPTTGSVATLLDGLRGLSAQLTKDAPR